MKKMECGIGELSHCLLYQTSFMEVAVKVPDGVEYPALPVETGQAISFHTIQKDCHLLFGLVDVDEDGRRNGACRLRCSLNSQLFAAHIRTVVPPHAGLVAVAFRQRLA